VQIDADKLIPAKWGDSDTLEKGDVIFAFGSPFGYIGSMTHGIVSALNRSEVGIVGRQGGFSYENFIQVDAPINPGNSGGPLVNLHGEVIGINTAIATETGAFNGIGFAIPINQAHPIYDQLKENGKVVRGYIGVKIGSVADNPELAKSFNYDKDNGVFVVETYPDTPASGKLQNDDIVTAINGKTVKDSTQLRNTVAAIKPGEEVAFTVFRKGKTQDVKIKIGEQPETLASRGHSGSSNGETGGETPSAETTAKNLGLHLANPNEDLQARFGIDQDTKGAVVTSVDRRSVAFRAGIRPGDVITEVGDKKIESANQATEALAKQDLSKGIRLAIVNQQGRNLVLLRSDEQ
jgi:serine protease Do